VDLKIDDVADLLNVSEEEVSRWIEQGSIPFYRIADQYRFSRMEIEDWFLKNREGLDKKTTEDPVAAKGGNTRYSLYRAIHKGAVLHEVPGETKDEVIKNAVEAVSDDFELDADVISELLLDREKMQATGLNRGIGLPHTREAFTNSLHDRVVVVFPEKPIADYGALDGEPVHTLFFLFACDDKRHLQLLARIAHLASRPEMLELLRERPNKVNLLERILGWEEKLQS